MIHIIFCCRVSKIMLSGYGEPGGLPLICRFSWIIICQTIIFSSYACLEANNPHPRLLGYHPGLALSSKFDLAVTSSIFCLLLKYYILGSPDADVIPGKVFFKIIPSATCAINSCSLKFYDFPDFNCTIIKKSLP